MIPPEMTSDEICEALLRFVETSGSEAFEKTFILPNRKMGCSIWCVVGSNSQAFNDMVQQWMKDSGFTLD